MESLDNVIEKFSNPDKRNLEELQKRFKEIDEKIRLYITGSALYREDYKDIDVVVELSDPTSLSKIIQLFTGDPDFKKFYEDQLKDKNILIERFRYSEIEGKDMVRYQIMKIPFGEINTASLSFGYKVDRLEIGPELETYSGVSPAARIIINPTHGKSIDISVSVYRGENGEFVKVLGVNDRFEDIKYYRSVQSESGIITQIVNFVRGLRI